LLPRLAIEVPEADAAIDPRALFAAPVDDVWLEVGFGAGEHLAGQAIANPAVGLIGCEPYINGVAALLARIESDALANVRLFADDARLLLPALTEASLGRVFVLFADPWPKRRHRHRRFLSRPTLAALARVLRDGGELVFASDSAEYVRSTLALATHHPAFAWPAAGPADWREPGAGWIETRYEAKARRVGARCYYLRFHRCSRECEK
jgi:tRNA (guanine-N7-)-methyltransferase